MYGSTATPDGCKQRARELFTWAWWKTILVDALRELLFGRKAKQQYHAYWVWSQRWGSWEYRITAEGFDLPLPPGRPEFPAQAS